MKYTVKCQCVGCFLHDFPAKYDDAGPAEALAFYHEKRWEDTNPPYLHTVLIELNGVPVSKNPKAATGDKGGGNG